MHRRLIWCAHLTITKITEKKEPDQQQYCDSRKEFYNQGCQILLESKGLESGKWDSIYVISAGVPVVAELILH